MCVSGHSICRIRVIVCCTTKTGNIITIYMGKAEYAHRQIYIFSDNDNIMRAMRVERCSETNYLIISLSDILLV